MKKTVKVWIGAGVVAGVLAGTAVGGAAETQSYLDTAHLADQVKAKKAEQQKQEFWIVTNEIKTKLENGKEIEAYRWDPGFLTVEKGKQVTLHFYGVKGKAHPFVIEGLGVKGNVEKGKVTSVTFTPEKVGTYKVICLTHSTVEANGPMIGYLRVE